MADYPVVEALQGESDEAPPHPVVYICRTEEFSACHRLHSPFLGDEENLKIFGACNNFHGHGHNYKVKVTLKGKVDPITGILINLRDLKQYMETAIQDLMDHKHIDKDVPYFKDKVSSAENISVFIWKNIKRELPNPEILYEVHVAESDKNSVYYRGDVE